MTSPHFTLITVIWGQKLRYEFKFGMLTTLICVLYIKQGFLKILKIFRILEHFSQKKLVF